MQKIVYEIFENNLKRVIKDLNYKKFLIAYSGGVDSTVLLDLFLRLKKNYNIEIFVCYVNHNLRGEESCKEENFVKEHLTKLNVNFFIESVPPSYWNNVKSKSIEMAAREIRYSIFKKIAVQNKIDYIVTAHHFMDKIETFFLNLIRGTDLQSLSSIPFKNRNIIRPLLNISKKDIDQYAKDNNLKHIIDSSNLKNIYKRNIVRNKLLPVISELQPFYEKSFAYIFKFIKEEEDFLKKYIRNILKKLFIFKSNDIFIIDYNLFKKKHIFIQKRIIKHILKKIGCSALQNINLFESIKKTRVVYKKSYLFVASKFKFLYFINLKKLKNIERITINTTGKIESTNFIFEILDDNSADYKKNIVFNKENVIFPFTVRNLEDNDTIFINKKDKSIKKLLKKEIGIPDILIPYTIVIENSNKEIIAFLINNIFRVNEKYFVKNDSNKLVFKITPLP
ncbi:MAG TPA: tRNA lysidine(34) synthetase TilS [Spirochaetota bacterium]|nr:tRNA lysidine(34) synthetase TilS [Spirochaetota bacterium]HOL57754.1 tRNA lysidine(34) synthetase TilS [Spirochaetota bacterium]HPP04959.1 tRNA lysidine(34) synthetase TilS [Spirochaetota bacterium]